MICRRVIHVANESFVVREIGLCALTADDLVRSSSPVLLGGYPINDVYLAGTKCAYEYQRKKPGLKGGAVEALSQRVKALEDAVFDGRDLSAASLSSAPTEQPNASTVPTTSDALGGILSLLTKEIHHLNSNLTTTSSRGPSIAIATPPPSDGHVAPHGNETLARIENPPKRVRLNAHVRSLSQDEEDTGSSLLAREDFLEELLDAHFNYVHPWIPILHEMQFRQRLSSNDNRDPCLIILHAIVVASLRFVESDRFSISPQEIQREVQRSRNYVVLNAMGSLAVENLQALLLVAFTYIGQGEETKAWSAIGSLARTVQFLHLSVEDTDLVEPVALLSNLPILPAPKNWIEEEERRRAFWNVFLLDRFCSITTGWNVSLTADDVCRRLPIDGGLWRRNQPALTPYLGIWDHSAAKIGNTTTFLPSKYESPGKPAASITRDVGDGATNPPSLPGNLTTLVDMSKLGAFSYYVESVETLSRINTYFVQQKIDFSSKQDVLSWLTRFKELDLRLVHWKMFLPQRWKESTVDSSSTPTCHTVMDMDPNMTLAHITHNTSSILLHQRIAYPQKDLKHLKLPSTCSADTCYVAATETANITMKYLECAPGKMPVAPQFAICVFVSARTLLLHSQHYQSELAPEFWLLITCLETMSRRWQGQLEQVDTGSTNFAGTLATQLRHLHNASATDRDMVSRFLLGPGSREAASGSSPSQSSPALASGTAQIREPPADAVPQATESPQLDHGSYRRSERLSQQSVITSPVLQLHDESLRAMALPMDELSTISQGLMDQSFAEMNRIINFDDFMFITHPEEFPGMSGA